MNYSTNFASTLESAQIRTLGITKQAISRWIHGSKTLPGNHIPFNQLTLIEQIFNIKLHWFAKSYDEFESYLFRKLENDEKQSLIRPERISTSLLPTTSPHVFGREAELAVLDSLWRGNITNVVQVIAFGGVGKSCLVNHWLSRLSTDHFLGAVRVYAWSFYWQGASTDVKSTGDFFMEHALEWFGDEAPSQGAPWSKATRLANLIRSERTLLILDGLEPLQYIPGPRSGFIENPALALLVRELAAEMDGLCLITSRLEVSDLESYDNERVATLKLNDLTVKASIDLLANMGVKGSPADFQRAVAKFTSRPLSLTLLGGYLKIVHRGEVASFDQISSLFDEQQGSAHARKIMLAYLTWYENRPEMALLNLVGLMDRATTLSEIQTIARLQSIEGLTSELADLTHDQWCYLLNNLGESNLLSVKSADLDLTIDCHPIVRDFLSTNFQEKQPRLWIDGHFLIFNYLRNLPVRDELSMTELAPLFRAVIHGAQSQNYNAAFEVYFERIKQRQFSMFTSGSHYADQSCIRSFFEKEWSQPVQELNEEAQHYLLSCTTTNLIYLGEIREAIHPARLSIDWFIGRNRWIEAVSVAAPLASMLIAIGKLNDAYDLLLEMNESVIKSENVIISATAASFKAFILFLAGKTEEARKLFEESEKPLHKFKPDSPVLFPTISSYYCKFLLDTGNDQAALDRLLKTFAWREGKTWQVAIDTTSLFASDLLVLGLTFLKRRDLINSRIYLDQQVELFRSADEVLYLPTGLHSRARYFIDTGDYDSATRDLNEALEISSRTGAVFGEWETYLNFSCLYKAQDNIAMCARYLEQARSLPDMELYHFRDAEIAELEAYVT